MITNLAIVGALTSLLLVGLKKLNDRFRVGPNAPMDWRYWLAGALSGAVAAIAWMLK